MNLLLALVHCDEPSAIFSVTSCFVRNDRQTIPTLDLPNVISFAKYAWRFVCRPNTLISVADATVRQACANQLAHLSSCFVALAFIVLLLLLFCGRSGVSQLNDSRRAVDYPEWPHLVCSTGCQSARTNTPKKHILLHAAASALFCWRSRSTTSRTKKKRYSLGARLY